MSEAQIDILRAGYEAFNRRDWAGMFQAAAPDFEMITAARVTNPGTYHGTDAAMQVMEDLFEPFEEVSAEPEEFLPANGDRIVTLVIMRFRPHGTCCIRREPHRARLDLPGQRGHANARLPRARKGARGRQAQRLNFASRDCFDCAEPCRVGTT